MFSKLITAWVLMALCVAVHAMGMTAAMNLLEKTIFRIGVRFWVSTWLLIRVAGWAILLHLAEIALWAFFYAWRHALPDMTTALYFSAVTYTTTGYGDVVLPGQWRLVGGVEALTGILMCGWSAAFFFAVVSQTHEARQKAKEADQSA
ncbi:MAG TPA: potassium channel family protein [Chthoniobacterales bacterium]|nr:potassium channel family protein [Chthoniobacterales bacterium]